MTNNQNVLDILYSLLCEELFEIKMSYQRSTGCRCNSCWSYFFTVYDIDGNSVTIEEEFLPDAFDKLNSLKEKILPSGVFPEEIRKDAE